MSGSGTTPISVENTVTSLKAGAEYHYRLVASNKGGMSYSADRTFATELTSTPALGRNVGGEQDITKPASVTNSLGEQYDYYRSSNGQLYFWYWNTKEWKLEWLGEAGAMSGNPVATIKSNNEQQIFYRGNNGQLHWWWWNDHEWKLEWMGEAGAMDGEPSS